MMPVLGSPADFSNSSRPMNQTGTWLPLPRMITGYVIYPFHPSAASQNTMSTPQQGEPGPSSVKSRMKNRFSWSGLAALTRGQDPQDDTFAGQEGNPYEVALDIGDEIFAFEEYRCMQEEDGKGELWYRGYIIQSTSIHHLSAIPSSKPPDSLNPASYPRPEPSVLLGIFPASIVHTRNDPLEGNEVSEAYLKAVKMAEDRLKGTSTPAREMEALREEDETEISPSVDSHVKTPGAPQVAEAPEAGSDNARYRDSLIDVKSERRKSQPLQALNRPNRPKSLVLNSIGKSEVEEEKDQPPLPTLTAGDSTVAGQYYPIVDEISCAIREWYGRLPTYLANREYRLFNIVVQHIDALFLGRRQLLSQTLSADELIRVRRECVSRLVKCNVSQGLDVIVRSLEDGSVMVVDKERALSEASYISGVEAYVQQVQFAYIDLIPLDKTLDKPPATFNLTSSHRLSLQRPLTTSTTAQHLLLDVRAFIASPCAPSETAELFFSLFSKSENRFVTEEYCLILNHLGSPARDPEQRIGRSRSLFIDIKAEEINHGLHLVCKLVRNGALKQRTDSTSGLTTVDTRKSSIAHSNQYLSPHDHSTIRSRTSISTARTDDSWSVTSGFGGHRTQTIETSVTSRSSDGRPSFRRPIGVAVSELPKGGNWKFGERNGVEFSMPIYTAREEERFASLHEDIIHGRTKEYIAPPRNDSIVVAVKPLHGDVSELMRANQTLLSDVPHTSRLGFSDVVIPPTIRNDIYIKLESANYSINPTISGGSIRIRNRPTTPSNIGQVQVSVEVRRMDGTVIPDILYAGGSGEPPILQYQSICFPTTEKPNYGELLKISLDPSSMDAHLFLTFRSRSKDKYSNPDPLELEKPFAFAFLPLINLAGAVKDGSHELLLYRPEKNLQPGPNIYFGAPATSSARTVASDSTLRSMTPLRDRLIIKSLLCSSVHSQNDTIRSLFTWQSLINNREQLSSILQVFMFVGEEEIAKFVPTILDSLFSILTSNLGERQGEMNGLVFSALIKVLSMSTDRRFPGFPGLLDVYLNSQFNYPSSSTHLLSCMKSVMSMVNTSEYRSFLKVWHLIFRFIIKSRELHRTRSVVGLDATSAHIEADFKKQVKSVLNEINTLMRSEEKANIGTQTLAVQHYSDLIPSLAQIFPAVEISEMVVMFTDTLSRNSNMMKGSIAIYKLLLILQVIKNVFDSAESRGMLVPAIVRWIKPHLGKYDEGFVPQLKDESEKGKDLRRIKWLECNRLAITVCAWSVNSLQEWLNSPLIQKDESLRIQEQDNLEYMLTLIPHLCLSYNELKSSENQACLSRQRSEASVWKEIPDIFPISHPFSLISNLPPPSLLEQQQSAGESGIHSVGTFNCALAESSTVLLSLILATPKENLDRYLLEMVDIEGPEYTAIKIKSFFDFALSVIRFEAFPKSWLTISLTSFSAVIKFLKSITDLIRDSDFIPVSQEADKFDEELFMKCFILLSEICGSDELALEDHSQQKRRAGWIIAGDLRDEGASLLISLWSGLGASSIEDANIRHGGYQTRFGSLAERILGLCLSSHDQLCETAVDILFSMIYAEYIMFGKFSNIENEIFAKLDGLFSSKSTPSSDASDSTMRAYFITQLRSTFDSQPSSNPNFAAQFTTIIDEVELFIDLLLAIRDLPEIVEWKDERSAATYRLMDFIKRIGKSELYIRFVTQLVRINVDAKDWLAAGLAMHLYAQVYDWTDGAELVVELKGDLINLPSQTQFARRESLYYVAIDYFTKAEAYEFALGLCQELTTQHQIVSYGIEKMMELLNYQAKLWEAIGSKQRPKPEYFRIAYWGDCTPIDRGKEFVVRGQPWQRFSDFCESIQVKFPAATIHRSKIPPSETAISESDIIWITVVHPEPETGHPALRDGVHSHIQEYHRYNGVRRFTSTRPFFKESKVGNRVNTWTEKTIITVADDLPGLLNRSEVIDVSFEEISPAATATAETIKATESLRAMYAIKPGYPVDVKSLGTALNGAVDSPVSGGIKLYRDTFLAPSYIVDNPDEEEAVQAFQVALSEYVRAVHDGLRLHGKVCKDITFHEVLKSHYYRAFPDESIDFSRISEGYSSTHTTPAAPQSASVARALPVPFTLGQPIVPILKTFKDQSSPSTSLNSEHPSGQSLSPNGMNGSPSLPTLRLGHLNLSPSLNGNDDYHTPSNGHGNSNGHGMTASFSNKALNLVGIGPRTSSIRSNRSGKSGSTGLNNGDTGSMISDKESRRRSITPTPITIRADHSENSGEFGMIVVDGEERPVVPEKSMLRRLSAMVRRDSRDST